MGLDGRVWMIMLLGLGRGLGILAAGLGGVYSHYINGRPVLVMINVL